MQSVIHIIDAVLVPAANATTNATATNGAAADTDSTTAGSPGSTAGTSGSTAGTPATAGAAPPRAASAAASVQSGGLLMGLLAVLAFVMML